MNVKAKGQVERVNGLVSEALTTTQHVSKQIQHGIKVPVEKVASWVTAAKLGIEHLGERLPFMKDAATRPTPKPAAPSGPRPVPGTPSGVRIVHSAEDEARISSNLPKKSPLDL